ncbi:MAG: globin family protein [Betaproteobacteria bacterium]
MSALAHLFPGSNMSPYQIVLVKQSFERLRPISMVAAEIFYDKLFEIDPSLRSMFKGDMKRQGSMLMSMIDAAVRGLDNPHALIPMLKSMGARHSHYGVQDVHYATVGNAFLHTLEIGLGEDFIPDVRDAWLKVYGLIASTMLEGAREVPMQNAA